MRALLLFAAFAAAGAVLMFWPMLEHWQARSPDGSFVAVARTQPFYWLVPTMPGGGSDKPGLVTVYRGERSCGSVWVDMVSMAYDLRWQIDALPRRAEIRLFATWNLDTCTIETSR